MKTIILYFLLKLTLISSYSRAGAVKYAKDNVNNANHDCNTPREACTPYSYFGWEHCGYSTENGNCANFVSQCLVLGGGHPPLTGSSYCRGYPCGFEEVGAWEMGHCLPERGWISTCGYLMEPPSYIKAGDVLIYHNTNCDDDGHAVLITVGGTNPKITCQSSVQIDQHYNYMATSKPYYQWIHYND